MKENILKLSLAVKVLLILFIFIPLFVALADSIQSLYLPIIFNGWPPTSKLVISELLYNPSGKEPDMEWVEFYNAGIRDLDLSEYKFGDEETIGEAEGMLQFPPGAKIAPGQVIIVACSATAFFNRYGVTPDYEMRESDPLVPNMYKYTAWAGGIVEFNNSGDEVLILDGKDQLIDTMAYGNSTHFFDPTVKKVADGHSLERFPVDMDTDSAADWTDQPSPNPWSVRYKDPTPTPTPAPSNTPDPNITPTLTLTPHGSLTPTLTPTTEGTPTLTETITETPIPSSTPEATPEEARLLISEVLYDPDGDEPAAEWIEIYNGGGSDLTLSAYKIGDEETSGGAEGMFQFPKDAKIVSGGVVVIANQALAFQNSYGFIPDYELSDSDPQVPDLAKYTTWASGSIYLSNTGDEVLLLDSVDQIVDTLSWGDSNWAFEPPAMDVSQGHSLERIPVYQDTNSADDWHDQPSPQPGSVDPPSVTLTPTITLSPTSTSTPTLSLTPSPTSTVTSTSTKTPTSTATGTATPTKTIQPTPAEGRLLISEVLYDPVSSEPDAEWIELHNSGGSALNLTGYKIGDEETQGSGEGMYIFPDGAQLASGGILIVANQAAEFTSHYGFKPDYELSESDIEVPNLEKYSDWATGSMALSNTGDEVLILDEGDGLVDALSWGSSTWAFDPAAPDVDEGHSLVRYPADQDTDTADDWRDQASPNPGVTGLDGSLLLRIWNWLLMLFC
jgi:hypothetical protein